MIVALAGAGALHGLWFVAGEVARRRASFGRQALAGLLGSLVGACGFAFALLNAGWASGVARTGDPGRGIESVADTWHALLAQPTSSLVDIAVLAVFYPGLILALRVSEASSYLGLGVLFGVASAHTALALALGTSAPPGPWLGLLAGAFVLVCAPGFEILEGHLWPQREPGAETGLGAVE
jgi:hypothetical protein